MMGQVNWEDRGATRKRKAEPVTTLMKSDSAGDIAEYQWRFTLPLVTIILALLAIPLSRSRPRQGKFSKMAVALLVFALYYNLINIAKTWVDQGRIPEFPGIWVAHAIPAILLLILLMQPYIKYRFGLKRTAVS